jgi:hypothetical protein
LAKAKVPVEKEFSGTTIVAPPKRIRALAETDRFCAIIAAFIKVFVIFFDFRRH